MKKAAIIGGSMSGLFAANFLKQDKLGLFNT